MSLSLDATLVEGFFPYRCERQARHGMMGGGERLSLSIVERPEANGTLFECLPCYNLLPISCTLDEKHPSLSEQENRRERI